MQETTVFVFLTVLKGGQYGTNASRSGVPIEIVSKIILRHANLSTTQRYLGKVPDTKALRRIENLYA
jgi:integrase/recombinase XerD